MGNVLVSTGRKGRKVMLAAHMDEVGLMISGISKEGLLYFKKVGGIDDRVLLAKVVLIGKDRIPGVIGAKPIHKQEPKERESVIRADQLFIDIGASRKEEAERWVHPGDVAVFATQFERYGNVVKAKALDDRVGVAILLRLLEQTFDLDLHVAFTVQEEVGLRGARTAAYQLEPECALVVEGTICSDIPEIEPHQWVTKLGAGAALSVADHTSLANRGLLRVLEESAQKAGVRYQFRESSAGGNDAGAIQVSRAGVPTASVSVPVRYLHSPCSIADSGDIEDTYRLLEAFLRRVEGGLVI
ncbi:MAG TPA: M42 family metallopeptidase [Firmicutes bacterium]|nr:M42 family metallopeptidase [Bacillota bacterium]